jgi:hypothetical protein
MKGGRVSHWRAGAAVSKRGALRKIDLGPIDRVAACHAAHDLRLAEADAGILDI